MENKLQLFGFLGLMSKARQIVNGEALIEKIRANKVYFVVISEDIGNSMLKKITDKCQSFKVPFVMCGTKIELSEAVGKKLCSAVGITSINGAKKIQSITKAGE